MATDQGHILVVDDNIINRMLLRRTLEERGYTVSTAADGQHALDLLQEGGAAAIDVVLLDILMPQMDGYHTLAHIKQATALRHIPVIMISAVDEIDSVIKCIEMGATDYLPKPFNAAVLQARLTSSLARKRLRDLELEYLEQVGYVTEAAAAVEPGAFEPARLDNLAARTDALGQLARVFQRMAREVRAREERLVQEVRELRIEIDEARQAQQVAEIIESDYFQHLRHQADQLREIIEKRPTTAERPSSSTAAEE